MEQLKFYMAVLKLMLEKQEGKPKARRWNPKQGKRFRHFGGRSQLRPKRSMRGGQTLRSKSRHNMNGQSD
ncbi:MAG: hypothetical protein P1V97_03535 [Planctomycetota bacterium]|nr:hypothetical protein [Planctomycetota bacterium]